MIQKIAAAQTEREAQPIRALSSTSNLDGNHVCKHMMNMQGGTPIFGKEGTSRSFGICDKRLRSVARFGGG
ncbi:MAG: hypothetical protein ACTSYI_06680 [Promethearchaeota archaeon]